MRFVHHVIQDLQGHPDYPESPMDAALQELLGGERGSLPNLADRFTQAGLGHIMASWIGHGANLPVTPDELRHVLGEERVQDLATLTDLTPKEFLIHLARRLPGIVHRMTPEGEL